METTHKWSKCGENTKVTVKIQNVKTLLSWGMVSTWHTCTWWKVVMVNFFSSPFFGFCSAEHFFSSPFILEAIIRWEFFMLSFSPIIGSAFIDPSDVWVRLKLTHCIVHFAFTTSTCDRIHLPNFPFCFAFDRARFYRYLRINKKKYVRKCWIQRTGVNDRVEKEN